MPSSAPRPGAYQSVVRNIRIQNPYKKACGMTRAQTRNSKSDNRSDMIPIALYKARNFLKVDLRELFFRLRVGGTKKNK